MSEVVWSGELRLLEARWTDKDGHTVKFQLVSPDEEKPNPFKAFTKRRGGKAGTRFHAAFCHVQASTSAVVYDGEVMLAGWGDTSTQGYTVTFWCEPPGDDPEQPGHGRVHPFESFVRTDSFMVALVELDDDNAPVEPKVRERVEKAGKPREPQPQKLAAVAGMLCNNPDFWSWINTETDGGIMNGEEAAVWMRAMLGIESRRQLDTDPEVAKAFHETIRRPFVAWREGW